MRLALPVPADWQNMLVVPARHLQPAPQRFIRKGSILEPTAFVAQAFLRSTPYAGETVVVIGDGTIGLLAVQVLHLFSPTVLMLAGSHDERLAIGRRLGATQTISSKRDKVEQFLHDLTQGRGADLVFEGGGPYGWV